MSNFFNIDNPVFSALSKLCDIIILGVLWVFLCIGVVTMGPASTAVYYAMVKVVRRERGYLLREFFKSFRLNFKRGAIIGVVLFAMFLILALDLYSVFTGESSTTNTIFAALYITITLFLMSFTIYVFPILSRFDMNIKQLIKASMFMSMKHLPSTILMLLVWVASIIGILFVYVLVFILPPLAVFVNSFLMERILKKYIPKPENQEEDTSTDTWYLE